MENEIQNTTNLLQEYMDYIQDNTKAKKTPMGFEKIDKQPEMYSVLGSRTEKNNINQISKYLEKLLNEMFFDDNGG